MAIRCGHLLIGAACFVGLLSSVGPLAAAQSQSKQLTAAIVPGMPGHRYIMVDQFGYRPGDPKVAVMVDARVGYNAADSFVPGAIFEVRRAGTGERVFAGAPKAYKGGQVHANSGDAGYWFDFSRVTAPGSYFLYDPENKARSHTFDVREDIYADLLRAAVRMFFYNRAGADKKPPFPSLKKLSDYLGGIPTSI